MPVEVIWDDPDHTILRQIYSGAVTFEDYYKATRLVNKMAASVPHRVHVIFDRRAVTSVPARMMHVLRYANSKVPPNTGLRIIVGASLTTRIIVDMGRAVAPRLIHEIIYADTLEEAYSIIQRQG